MFRLIFIVIIGLAVWKGFEKYQLQQNARLVQEVQTEIDLSGSSSKRGRSIELTSKFQCDGRTHCSQMTSCEEANFFLKNCPGVKMDGNNDGIPCEKQWCK